MEETDEQHVAQAISTYQRKQKKPEFDRSTFALAEDAEVVDEFAKDEVGVIREYRQNITAWQEERNVGDADQVVKIQANRSRLAQQIFESGLTHDEDLREDLPYLAADIAWNSRPDPRDGEYADYMRRRNLIRRKLFNDPSEAEAGKSRWWSRKKETETGRTSIVGAETYARASAAISFAMNKGRNISDQYEMLAVRQEAVVQHHNNPRFIAEIALFKREVIEGHKGGKYDDEMLVDFDRGDLDDEQAKERSQALAEVFGDELTSRPSKSAPLARKMERFQIMRAEGQSIAHNQDAVVRFARMTLPKDKNAAGGAISKSTFEMGMQALDNKTYSDGVFKEWLESIPRSERKKIENEPVAIFRKARETFNRDYDLLDSGKTPKAGSTLAASFAVMERAGQEILKNYPKYNRNGQLNNTDDLPSLALFSKNYREKVLDAVPDKVEEKLLGKLGPRSDGGHQGEDNRNDGIRSGSATRAPKSKTDEEYTVDLLDAKTAETMHVVAADGNHVRISKNKEDAEAGKFVQLRLEGLTAPAMGQQTKSGKLDAGEEAKAHLEGLLGRYRDRDEWRNLSLSIEENKHGEKVVRAGLPSGEDLSQRMIRDGYGLPTHETEGKLRRENMAKDAEANRRGLWKEGFPEVDRTWRSESRSPALTAKDKRERLTDNVGEAMAHDDMQVVDKLSHTETKIFALPLEKWTAHGKLDEQVRKLAKSNPGRLMDIYENNLEILKDLRKRKDKLTPDEKRAHDRLDMGRRVIGKPLAELGHIDAEKLKRDGHPMMSRKGINANLDALRPIGKAVATGLEGAGKLAHEGAKRAPGALNSLLSMADEPSR